MAHICGDYEYELLSDGTAEIVYKGKEAHVVVPAKLDGHAVSSIRYYGFNWIENLKSVFLPDGLKKIDNFAFHHCDNLTGVRIPRSVTEFGNNVFAGCCSLTDVRIPEGITYIPHGMFEGCSRLEEMILPESVTAIEDSAFFGCFSLEEMIIPSGVERIGGMAFAYCSGLERIQIPDSVCSIDDSAFCDCNELVISAPAGSYAQQYAVSHGIATQADVVGNFRCCPEPDGTMSIMRYLGEEEEVTIPKEIHGRMVSTIREDAFAQNRELRRVHLPEGLVCIRSGAFLRCGALEAVNIPAGVKTIEPGAFLACRALREIDVSPENPAYVAINGALYTKDGKSLVSWPQATDYVRVMDGVENIMAQAFALCKGLRGVQLPTSLKSIGIYAFNWCEELNDIEFPPGLERIGDFAFHQCQTALQKNAEQWMEMRRLKKEKEAKKREKERRALMAIREAMTKIPGHTGFYYKNLVSGLEFGVREDEAFGAASVIKLPLFMHILKESARGRLSMEERLTVTQEDKVPICGALTLFTGDVTCDVRTLCRLMISISDNTATNRLIDYATIDGAAAGFAAMGLEKTKLTRKLFDSKASKRGLRNFICPKEIGALLEMLWRGEFVSEAVSKEAIDTLLLQQVDHKLNGKICGEVSIAHKTGEDDNLSNDVGIVYAKEPFIVCFAGHDTDVYEWEDLMRRGTYDLLRAQDEA